jgi:hypothetical protein
MKLDVCPFYIKNTFKIYVKYTKVKSISIEPNTNFKNFTCRGKSFLITVLRIKVLVCVKNTGFWWGDLRERDHLEEAGVNGGKY